MLFAFFGMKHAALTPGNLTVIWIPAGITNKSNIVRGVQIGIINYATFLYGVQIGLINIAENSVVPYMPVLNIGW